LEGRRTPSTCIPHLSKHASGHGALVGVSQHPQGLDFAGAIIFSQSVMASAASSTCEDAIASAGPDITIPAKRAGVSASDKAIKATRMNCGRRSAVFPLQEPPLACTSVPERQFYSVPHGKPGR